jgi:hypothetical protein
MAREWYRFFQNIFILTGSGSNATTLDELQLGPPVQTNSGTVTSVTGTPPVVSSGGNAPVISMPAATTSVDGYLTSTDWNTFNNKGTVSSVSVVSANGLAGTVATATTTPAVTLSTTVTGVLKGNGTAISAATSGTDYAPATSGTSILYGNGAGGFSNVTIGTGVAFTTGTLSATGLGGNVVGPASATDNAISRFDSTTGKLIQNSVTTIDDTGAATGFTTFAASTSVTTPTVQASNSAGLSLKNASGTTQINTGAGGGDNVSINVSTNLNGVNAQIDISPTGTGHVHIKPSGTGSIEIAPTNVGTIDNMTIGATAPKNGSFVDLSVTGTLSFDAAQGTAGQVLTSAGSGATPTWTTPTTGTVTSVAALTLGTSGTDLTSTVANGTTTPVITLQVPTASASNRGALSSTDWSTFNNKGSGSVTSVAQSFTGGLISVAGSPITTSGTLALTVAGTSGGVPYFSSASTWATSAALAASALVIGGGAGAAPATTTTGTGVVTALGVNTGTAGAFVVNGGALGTPSSGTVTNLTGTASININGTVGATTANTGKFTSAAFPGTTSGTATVAATAVAGTPTLTLPTTTGTLSINGPAFSAYQSTSTAVTASTLTKVLFDVELFDTNSNFASSRFTPTVEGYYQVNARVGLSSSVLTRGVGQIYKNGANVNSMEDTNGSTAYSSIGSALIYMNGSTDYLEIYVFIAGATTIYDGGATRTWFQAAMVRGA